MPSRHQVGIRRQGPPRSRSEPSPGRGAPLPVSETRPLSARSVNAVLAGLRTIFGVARRRKLIADDPTAYVAKLREEKPEVDPFDHDEVRSLLDAAVGWERCFLAVLLFAGLRPNEAFALRWDDLDWQHGQIRVRRTATLRRRLAQDEELKPRCADDPSLARTPRGAAPEVGVARRPRVPRRQRSDLQSREFPSSQLGEDPWPLAGAAAPPLSVPAYVRALAPGGRRKGFAAGGARSRAQHRADDLRGLRTVQRRGSGEWRRVFDSRCSGARRLPSICPNRREGAGSVGKV
jgi:integrase